MSLSDWLAAFSLACAAVAAWGAVKAVGQARQAGLEAAQDRRAARLDREWQQLDKIGDIVESIYWATDQVSGYPSDNKWKSARNRLRQLIAGAEHKLPNTELLIQSSGIEQAHARASTARIEIDTAMGQTIDQMQGIGAEQPAPSPTKDWLHHIMDRFGLMGMVRKFRGFVGKLRHRIGAADRPDQLT